MTHSGNDAHPPSRGLPADTPHVAASEESATAGTQWRRAWTQQDGQAHATDLFERTFAAQPATVQSTPGHIALAGSHTDYAGGSALTTVLAHRTYVAASARPDGRIRIVSAQAHQVSGPDGVWEGNLDTLATQLGSGWVRHVSGVLSVFAQRGYPVSGVDMAIESCVPIGAGVGSSAALEGAVALAASESWGLALDNKAGRAKLASITLEAETRNVGVPVGGVGQYTALRCGAGEGHLLDFRSQPPTSASRPVYHRDYGMCLMVINLRTPYDLRNGVLAQRKLECDQAAAALGVSSLREVAERPRWLQTVEQISDPVLRSRARHVVTEFHRVALVAAELSGTGPAQERFVDIGKAMYRSHHSLAEDFDVSTDAQHLAVNAAFHAGALGATLMGAGVGGAAIVLVRKSQEAATAASVDRAFVERGRTRPEFLTV
jgi:galactokinase